MRAWASLRSIFLAALALSLYPLKSGSGAGLSLEAYPEGVRFDGESGRPLGPARAELSLLRLDAGGRVLLRGLQDEVLGLVLRAQHVPGALTATVTPFVGPNGARSALRGSLFESKAVRITRASVGPGIRSLGPGSYPDVLLPVRHGRLHVEDDIQLWVDVFIPVGAAPGVHTGRITVGPATLGLDVRVLPRALPSSDPARLGAVNFGSFLEKEREDPRILREWLQLAHAHRLTVEVMRMTPAIGENGVIDWPAWVERVGPYVSGRAFTPAAGYHGPRSGQPLSRFIIPLTDWWPHRKPVRSRPADPALWSRTLRAWEKTVAKHGWFDLENATDWILFINSLDEAKSAEKLEAVKSYGPLIEAAELEDRRHLWFRVDGLLGVGIEGWNDARILKELGDSVVDLWNVHGAPWTIPWPLVKERRDAHSERVIFYASNTGGEPAYPPVVVDAPLIGARAWGWIVTRYALNGALNWEVDTGPGCVANPRCSPGETLNLDATLIFRGEEVGGRAHEPIASMRLKLLRRGAQDAALLAMLEQIDPTHARAWIERMVPRALGDRVQDGERGRWARDISAWMKARASLLDALEKEPVSKATPEEPTESPIVRTWFLGATAIVVLTVLVLFARRRARSS